MQEDSDKLITKKLKKENFFLPFAVFFSLPVIITSCLFFTNEDKSILIIIFLILFALVDIILWGIVTKVMLANLKNRLVLSKGIEHKATITKISEPVYIENGMKRYSINYEWIDDDNVLRNAVSGPVYLAEEANELMKNKIITIKVWKNSTVILSHPSIKKDTDRSVAYKLKHHVSYQKRRTCDYCGHPIGKNATHCPKCRAQILHKD